METSAAVSNQPKRRSLAAIVVASPAAWSISLLFSYVIQDFTCAAVASAGHPTPDSTLRAILFILNGALLAITIAAGVLGWSWLRRYSRQEWSAVDRFLAVLAVSFAPLFAFGIVLIAINPLVLEVCR